MKKGTAAKREKEKELVTQMISLYCKKKHGGRHGLCRDCAELDDYARARSDRCPFMETKTFCSNCKVHCYQPAMRGKIRDVMRFSFAKSSERLHTWFVNTKLYKKNLESYVQGKGMTRPTKLRIMATVTVLMAVGFTVMMLKAVYVPCIILACVWVFHIVYFTFGVKTLEE